MPVRLSLPSNFEPYVTPANPTRVPRELTLWPNWITWNDKIPSARWNEPGGRQSFAAVRESPRFGFVLTDTPYIGIDIDRCMDGRCRLKEPAERLLDVLPETYVEYSPGGRGLHLFYRAHTDRAHRRTIGDIGFEMYGRDRYFTVTGHPFIETDIATLNHQQVSLLRDFFHEPNEHVLVRGRGNENLDQVDLYPEISLATLESMLVHVKEHDYQTWLRIGMAIKTQFDGEEGFELWHKWSRQFPNYVSRRDCFGHWKTFRNDHEVNVTIASLVRLAKRGGYKVTDSDSSVDELGKRLEGFNREYAVVSVGSSVRILRMSSPTSTDAGLSFYTKHDLQLLTENSHVLGRDGKPRRLLDEWLRWPNRRQFERIEFCPPPLLSGNKVLNTWRGFNVRATSGNSHECWLDHVREVVCSGNDELFTWLIDWFADLVQRPGEMPGTAVCLRSAQGAGKGTLIKPFQHIFGSHFAQLSNEHHIEGRFNSHLVSKALVFVDEAGSWGGKKSSGDVLKALITEPLIAWEPKGIDVRMIRSPRRVIIASNNDWFLPATPDARRFAVFELTDNRRGDTAYFNQLHNLIETDGTIGPLPGDLLGYLLARDVKTNLRRRPTTKAFLTQTAFGILDVVEYLIHRVSDGTCDFIAPSGEACWIREDVQRAIVEYRKAHDIRTRTDKRHVARILKQELGLKSARPRAGATRVYVYELPDRRALVHRMMNIWPDERLAELLANEEDVGWRIRPGFEM